MHLAYDFAALQSSHKLEVCATEHLGTLRRLTGKWADPRSASILACDFAANVRVTTETVVLRSFPKPHSPGCCFWQHAAALVNGAFEKAVRNARFE